MQPSGLSIKCRPVSLIGSLVCWLYAQDNGKLVKMVIARSFLRETPSGAWRGGSEGEARRVPASAQRLPGAG
jgi:hypothetical protein